MHRSRMRICDGVGDQGLDWRDSRGPSGAVVRYRNEKKPRRPRDEDRRIPALFAG